MGCHFSVFVNRYVLKITGIMPKQENVEKYDWSSKNYLSNEIVRRKKSNPIFRTFAHLKNQTG